MEGSGIPDPVVLPPPVDTGRAEVDLRTGIEEEVGEGMLDPPPWRTEADWVVGFLLEGVGMLLPGRGMLDGLLASMLVTFPWDSILFVFFLEASEFSSTFSTLLEAVEFVEGGVSDSIDFCFTNGLIGEGAISLSGDFKNGLVDLATLFSSRVEL